MVRNSNTVASMWGDYPPPWPVRVAIALLFVCLVVGALALGQSMAGGSIGFD